PADRSVADLARVVLTPAPRRAVGADGARMALAGSDRPHGIDADRRDGEGARGGRVVPELAFAAVAPAAHAVVDAERAGRVAVAGERARRRGRRVTRVIAARVGARIECDPPAADHQEQERDTQPCYRIAELGR